MKQAPESTDDFILGVIHKHVWGGFCSPEEVHAVVDEVLEPDADEAMLRAAVEQEFAKKQEAEQQWPEVTDCDRLEAAFQALEGRGILALQNAGYTMSDGHDDAREVLIHEPGRYQGYCFYHGQDLERAVEGRGLMIAFDHAEGDVPDKVKIGLAVKEELERVGFATEWDGTADRRINVPGIRWERRYEG